LLQQFEHFNDKVPAVGTVEGSGFNKGEVGDEYSHLLEMFNATDQIVVSQIVFVNDRCPIGCAVINQNVQLPDLRLYSPRRGAGR
jgi:hypothetical protein